MPYKKIMLCLLMVGFLSCQNTSQQAVVFKKDAPAKEDVVKTWLRQNKNYDKRQHYFAVFQRYYNAKIAAKKYVEAAGILDVVSTKMVFFYDFKDSFLAIIKDFDANYRNKVSALKTTFVDNYYANYYYDKGNFQKSCDYFIKITSLEPNDYKSCYKIARANYELAYVYFGMGKQNLSLKANHQALTYYTKINDFEGLGSVYTNYADIYKSTGNQKKAVFYINKAIACFVKSGNTYDTYMSLYNKICIYNAISDPKTSALIDSTYTAFTKSNFDSDVLTIAISDFKVENLLGEHKLAEAKKMLDALQPVVQKVNSENWRQDFDATRMQYEIQNNPKTANVNDLKKAIAVFKENKQFEKLSLFYSVLKKHAFQNKDFEKALIYEEGLHQANDSIGSVAMRLKIAELETKYQTQKKEQQIVLQEKTILNKNTTIALLFSLFAGLLLIMGIYVIMQKQRKLKLERQSAQQYTKQLLEKTEEERKRIASDLHDSVSHELLSLKNSYEEKTEIINHKIDAIINDIRIISRNLHPVMFDKIGLKASVEQLVERTQSLNDFMVTADIEYTASLSTEDELQLYRIIQESLSNIIKYADAIAAKITIFEKDNMLFVEIKDNGKGFPVAETLQGKHAFGLHNIIERSRAIGGQAKIVSDKNGTVVTIEIKK